MMAPTATPHRGGRVAKSVAVATSSTSTNTTPSQALQKTPKSSRKRKQPGGTSGRTPMRSTTFYNTIELLNDLTSFCGVGSLDIKMPRRAGVGGEAPDGWLWLETPGSSYELDKSSIEASLGGLINCGVARCTYRMVTTSLARVRVYILPDDVGRSMISRSHEGLRKWLRNVMNEVDVSRGGWEGRVWRCKEPMSKFISHQDHDMSSLSEIFNTLESPNPNPELPWIKDENTKELLRDVLSEKKIPGMKSRLYKHQKRSVAMMLQKELAPDRVEDLRLRTMTGPGGEVYYLDPETMEIFESPRYYEDVKGGILAEEMGTGKTLICLAVILASKHQISYVPDEYVSAPPLRHSVASLSDMCVAAIWHNAIPWTQFADSIPENCTKMIRNNHGFYEVPPPRRSQSSRYAYDSSAMEKIYLGTGTIIVCPQNLVHQWEDEINKHFEKDVLKVLTLVERRCVPSVFELLRYDVVIFSRPCFDAEAREGRDSHGRTEAYGVPTNCSCPYIGATRVPNCVCFRKEAVYRSPLMSIHWKRIIVDEGHDMASSSGAPKSNGVCVAEKLPVERRWIVTGTPTSLLVGVAPEDENDGERLEREADESNKRQKDEKEHLDRIGRMVCDFLKQKPWAPTEDRRNTEKRASWRRYISDGFKKRQPDSTARVRQIFQRLFIRHRDGVDLPLLDVKIVKLMPGFFEKVSMNLIVGALKANEVTSERVGKDYMFDPASRGDLRVLTNNLLNRSGFYPSGYSITDVEGTVDTCRKYLKKNGMRCEERDIQSLLKAIEAGEMALKTSMWRDISVYHEMVYFLSDFPEQLAPIWSFSGCRDVSDNLPNTANVSALLEVDGRKLQHLQKSVNAHAHEYDIIHKLGSLGKEFDISRQNTLLANLGGGSHKAITGSSVDTNLIATNKAVRRIPATPGSKAKDRNKKTPSKTPSKTPLKSALKDSKPVEILPPDSPLAKARILGTASTKLTYLMNKIAVLHKTEKILIFYEAEDVAGYIAQALEILGVESLWYSGALSLEKRMERLRHFQHLERFRVLLMNLKHAARGLNITCASRLFFVSPVWRRDLERQAIKRAHRIGQEKDVYVETLILAGTAEDEMWRRRAEMTQKEQGDAKDSISDLKMRDIILNLNFLKVELDEGDGMRKASLLATPEPIFGDGKHGGVYDDIEETDPSAAASIATTPLGVPEPITSPEASTTASGSSERVASDLSMLDVQVASDLNPKVRWADSPPRASPAPSISGKRKSSHSPPAVSLEESSGSSSRSRPTKRKKRVGFKANDSKDWMEDSDDDFEAPAGKGKGRRI